VGSFRFPEFLYNGVTLADFHSSGKMPVNKGWLNIKVRDSAIKSGHSLNNLAEILSSPVAFDLQNFERRDEICADVELLGSYTKKLFIGGINIRNISTKAWSNLNEEIIEQFRILYLIARFLSLVLNFIYYCFIRLTGCQFIDSFQVLR